MNPHDSVYARLERVKALWIEISKTPKTSAHYQELADRIRAEASAYRTSVDAARGVDVTIPDLDASLMRVRN